MPGYDRTGPVGTGARTGRGLGRCGRPADGSRPVEESHQDEGAGWFGRRWGGGRGRGFGRGGQGRGWGFGMGRRAIEDPAGDDVTPRRQAFLGRRIKALTEELDRVKTLLSEYSRGGVQDRE